MTTENRRNYSTDNGYWTKAFDRLNGLNQQDARCIADFCLNHDPDPELLSWVFDNLRNDDNLDAAKAPDLLVIVKSLQDNHHYYQSTALPQIGQTFTHILKTPEKSLHLNLCEKLFNFYATSLVEHINEEEQLFEAIRNKKFHAPPIEISADHDHADETQALDQIIELLEQCADAKNFDPCNILLIRLRNLTNDLKIHTFIEEQLLFPILQSKH